MDGRIRKLLYRLQYAKTDVKITEEHLQEARNTVKRLQDKRLERYNKVMRIDNEIEEIRARNKEIKRKVFARGTHQTFGLGRTGPVEFALFDKVIYIVTPTDCFSSGIRGVADTTEALWMLKNHPRARAFEDVNP